MTAGAFSDTRRRCFLVGGDNDTVVAVEELLDFAAADPTAASI